MEIGRLNQRIVILEHRTKIDSIGNHITQWEEVTACWALVSIKNSAETMNTGVTKEIQSVSFTVRQNPYLLYMNSTTHRILFRGQYFDIVSVKPNYEKNDYLTITGEVRKAGVQDDQY